MQASCSVIVARLMANSMVARPRLLRRLRDAAHACWLGPDNWARYRPRCGAGTALGSPLWIATRATSRVPFCSPRVPCVPKKLVVPTMTPSAPSQRCACAAAAALFRAAFAAPPMSQRLLLGDTASRTWRESMYGDAVRVCKRGRVVLACIRGVDHKHTRQTRCRAFPRLTRSACAGGQFLV